jgi:glycosyltransferase involved in cell wall biosynthesis
MRSQIIGFRSSTKIKAGIWHIHDPELLPLALWLRMLGRKVIWDAHEDYFLQFGRKLNYRKYIPIGFSWFVNLALKTLLKLVDKFSNGVISATNSISLKYKNKNKVVIGNEAVLKEFMECKPTFSNQLLLFTGATDSSQCFDAVVKAVKFFPDLQLGVAGRDIKNPNIEKALELLGNQLVILGWLSREDLSKIISQSFLGFVTYENIETNDTNSPNKLFEFSASGLPCVATPTLANINWSKVSKGVYLAPNFDTNGIEVAIRKALSSESDWLEKSQLLRKWSAKEGSWEISEKRLLDFYENL